MSAKAEPAVSAEQEAALKELLPALYIDEEMVKKYTVPTESHSEKFRRGITTEFAVYKVAWELRKKFLEAAKKAGDLPDKLLEMALRMAKEYVASGGVQYYKNNVPTEKQYAQLYAIMNTPEFIKHPKAKEVLEAFISDSEAAFHGFPMKFEAYADYDHASGKGYTLMEQIDESYVPPLESLIDSTRLWAGREKGHGGPNYEVRRILFANVAQVLGLLARKDEASDQATVGARMKLLENNIEGAIEAQAPTGHSLMQSEIGKKALLQVIKERPASAAGQEAFKVYSGYYSRVAY